MCDRLCYVYSLVSSFMRVAKADLLLLRSIAVLIDDEIHRLYILCIAFDLLCWCFYANDP